MKNKGITLIEILFVLAIISILAGIIALSFSSFSKKESLNTDTVKILSVLQDARTKTLSSYNNNEYGVHFDENQIILFSGGTYNPSDPTNEIVDLSSSKVLSKNFSNGGDDILFKKITGEAIVYGTTTISLINDESVTKTIIIKKSGIVETQ